MNRSTMMAVDKRKASTAADKLVATTRGRQTGTDNNQLLRQWLLCRSIGVVVVALLGQEGGGGCAAVLVGRRRGVGGSEG
jgi:hypothetical protein